MSAGSIQHRPHSRWTTRLHAAARFGLQWRLLFWWVLLLSLPTLLLLLPVWRLLAAQLDHSVGVERWAHLPEIPMIAELVGRFALAGPVLPASGIGALLVFLLLLPLLNAMQVAAVRGGHRQRLGELLGAALHEYWPLVRLMIFSLILFALAGGVAAGCAAVLRKYRATAILESDVTHLQWVLSIPAVLVFAWVAGTVDAARAVLAQQPGRRSALRALWRGICLTIRRPLATLAIYGACTGIAALVLLPLLWLRLMVPTVPVWGWLVGQGLGLLIMAVPGWLHAARLHAMLAFGRHLGKPPFER